MKNSFVSENDEFINRVKRFTNSPPKDDSNEPKGVDDVSVLSMLNNLKQLRCSCISAPCTEEINERDASSDDLQSFLARLDSFITTPKQESSSYGGQKAIEDLFNQMQSAPPGGGTLNCTPICAYNPTSSPPNPTLESIQKRMLGSPPDKQWSQIRNSIEENSKALMLSRLANAIVTQMPVLGTNRSLGLYNGPCWQYVDFTEFVTIIRKEFWNEQDVLDSLSDGNFRELMMKVRTSPSIIKREDDILPYPNLINFRDAAYDFETKQFIKQSPDHYFFNYIDISKSEIGKGSGDYFEYFMEKVTGGNMDIYALILEMLAITISSKAIKGFFVMLGKPDSGKSQLGLLIQHLLGRQNIAVIPKLNSFKNTHTTATLKGKKACLCMDLSRSCIDEESLSIIKQISGRDPISIEPKFKDMERLDNTATLILGANRLPLVDDPIHNDAYFKRMKVIPFITIPESERITDIADKMAMERGYIIAKLLDTLDSLRRRDFKLTEVSVEINEHGELVDSYISPIESFYKEICVEDTESVTYTEDLYTAYRAYSVQRKYPHQEKIPFSQAFAKLTPHLEKVHTSRNGKTLNGYRGLNIRGELL